MGRVVLIGAGPGDPGLLTCRGRELVQSCDVLIYDHLAGDRILSMVKPECVLIDAGKHAGGYSRAQEEIDACMIRCAAEHELVVRLKGGDPFVFGRGFEEMEALCREGISCEVIPGVTSAVAALELAGIPLTYRGVSRSFHVITGHRMKGEAISREEFQILAKEEGTLVFLMAVSNMREICDGLISCGRPTDTPAAVVENASYAYQRRVDGMLSDIAEHAEAAGVSSPAVLVIGKTAALHVSQAARIRILTVGTVQTIQRLTDKAKAYHMQVEPVLELETVLTDAYPSFVTAIHKIHHYDWIMFFSKQSVRIFEQALAESDADIRQLAGCLFAVNSPPTASELHKLGIHADFISEKPDAETFVKAFLLSCGRISSAGRKGRILLARSFRGSDEPELFLRKAGFTVDSMRVYDVRARENSAFSVGSRGDVIAFLSASGVHAYMAAIQEKGVVIPEYLSYYCIGPRTKEALVSYGITDRISTPDDGTLDGLLKRIDADAETCKKRG